MLYEYGNLCCNNINTIIPQEQVIPSNKKHYQEDSSSNTEIKKTRTLTENSIMSETIPKEGFKGYVKRANGKTLKAKINNAQNTIINEYMGISDREN